MASSDPNITLLQAQNSTIAGVTNAPDNYPGNLNDLILPVILVTPGPSIFSDTGKGGIGRGDIDYIMRLYVAPVGEGSDDQPVQLTIELWKAIIDLWRAYIAANGHVLQYKPVRVTIRVEQEYMTSEGYELLEWPAGSEKYYHGATVIIKLREEAIEGLDDEEDCP